MITHAQMIIKDTNVVCPLTKVVGSYEITGNKTATIEFNFCNKPNFIHRLFCKILLGWTWKDK